MFAEAVVFGAPKSLTVRKASLRPPQRDELVVRSYWSGVSTGTERLLHDGTMPAFPGFGYPLVPGYETVGRVEDAGENARHRVGELVYVPGCSAYRELRGLFGGTASRLVASSDRVLTLEEEWRRDGVLMALAATAYHALHAGDERGALMAHLPELIVGHGVLGRLLARITIALGGAPVVWEENQARRIGAQGYDCIAPADDDRMDYRRIIDASGDEAILDTAMTRIGHGGEIVLAGFYGARMAFPFPLAFMREARLRVAAEFKPHDMRGVHALVRAGHLSLTGLVTHASPIGDAAGAYRTAFGDADCLKMILDWGASE